MDSESPKGAFKTAFGLLAAGLMTSALVAGLPAAGAAPAAAAVHIRQTALGNVFSLGETPSFTVEGAGGALRWSVHDLRGQRVAEGKAAVRGKSARIGVPLRNPGYYELRVTDDEGASRAALAVLPTDRSAAEPFTYSVQTHFAQGWDRRIIPLIQKAGVEAVRDAQVWADIEQRPGEYDFGVRDGRYQKYMTELREHGIGTQIQFGLSNKNYDGGCTPYTPEGRNAFAAFAREVLRHHGKQIRTVGVYNEPNLVKFGDHGPGDDNRCHADGDADARPGPHAALAREVHAAVKAVRPDVKVSAPELSAGAHNTAEWLPWLDAYLGQHDGTGSLDAVSVHPYRRGGRTPEGLIGQQLDPVRALMEKHGAAGKPTWIGELGWRSENVGLAQQAAYVPRAHVLAMKGGVPRFNWYSFMDSRSGSFGLIRDGNDPLGAYSPKPSYVAYSVMTAELSGRSYQAQDETPAGVQSHRFTGGVRVIWTSGQARTVRLKATRPVRVTGLLGESRTVEPENGQVSLRVSGDAQYVHGDVAW